MILVERIRRIPDGGDVYQTMRQGDHQHQHVPETVVQPFAGCEHGLCGILLVHDVVLVSIDKVC